MADMPIRILAAEDERIVARDLSRRLTDLGYDVAGVAASADEVLDMALKTKPDLVLMDIRLKDGTDGIEAAQRLRDLVDVPVVYVTAHSDNGTLARAGATFPSGYILKPFHDRELHAVIQMALQTHARARELRERAARHSATRQFAQSALSGSDTYSLMQEAALTLARALGAQDSAILEYLPRESRLVARAGEGPSLAQVGEEQPVTAQYQAVLASRVPVAVSAPGLSGLMAAIPGGKHPIGIATVHAAGARSYSAEEIEFLQNVADTLGWAVGRARVLAELEGVNSELRAEMERRQAAEERLTQAQKMDALGRLAGGVAHDFNNILTAICGYNDLLLASLAGNAELEGYAEQVRDAANRASALTRQMLAFSRRQAVQPRPVDLNQSVLSILKMLRRLIGENIGLVTNLSPVPVTVMADPAQIDQVIVNLAVNSRDAMPAGGSLTLSTANVALAEDLPGRQIGAAPGSYGTIGVTDTGHGMDSATLRHSFDPFFTTKTEGAGTGLGLSIVYGIVRQNHGEIVATSQPGQGSTFQICLPACQGKPQERTVADAAHGAPPAPGTILLVEDDAAVRGFVRSILSQRGFSVIEAGSADEALRAVENRSGAIDLLLTDVVMPGMSGFDLARELRRADRVPRILFMSGYIDQNLADSGFAGFEAALIRKPFSADALHAKLREILGAGG